MKECFKEVIRKKVHSVPVEVYERAFQRRGTKMNECFKDGVRKKVEMKECFKDGVRK